MPPLDGDGERRSAPVISIWQIIGILRRNLFLIGVCVVLATVVAGVILSKTTPEYSATSRVRLSEPERVNHTFRDFLAEIDVDDRFIAGEIESMLAGPLLAQVVEQLKLYELPEFNPALQETSELEAAIRDVRRTVMSFVRPPAPPPPAPSEGGEDGVESPLERAVSAQVRALGEHGDVIGTLRSRLRVRQVGRASVVELNVTSADPRLATAIANLLAESYLAAQRRARVDNMLQMANWLDSRLHTLRQEVERSEAAVQAFIAREVSAKGFSEQQLNREIDQLTVQLVSAENDFARATAELSTLKRIIEEQGIDAAAAILSSSLLTENRAQMQVLRSRQADVAERFGTGSEKLGAIGRDLEALAAQNRVEIRRITEEKAALVDSVDARRGILQTQIRELSQRVVEISQSNVALRQLRREADANKAIYEKFLASYKQAREFGDLAPSTAEVLAYADVPKQPWSPRTKVMLALGMIAGGFVGVGIAFLRELLRRGFVTQVEVGDVTGVECYGSFSRLRSWAGRRDPLDLMVEDGRSTLAKEARALRSMLWLSCTPRPGVIAVTGCRRREGATTTTVLLARAFGEMGLACAVIDADFAARSLSRRLSHEDGPDLVDCLEGRAHVDHAMRIDPRLRAAVLPIVRDPMDPSGLLMSRQMGDVLARLRATMDVVLIDTPPVLLSPEPLVVASRADMTLLAIQWASTPRKLLGEAVGALDRINTRRLGVVMHEVNRRAEARYQLGTPSRPSTDRGPDGAIRPAMISESIGG